MASFTVPADAIVSPVAVDPRDVLDPLSQHIMRWYRARPRGRNVFILIDNSVTENLPAATYDANGVLLLSGWDRVANDSVGGKQVFYGGHAPYPLTAAQVTILTAAGYGANIS